MKPEQRSLLAVVLSIGVLVLWYTLFAPPVPEQPVKEQPATTTNETTTSKKESSEVSPPLAEEKVKGPEQTTTLSSPLLEMSVSNHGAQPISLILRGYYEGTEKESPPINLIKPEDSSLELVCRHCNFSLPSRPAYRLVEQKPDQLTYEWHGAEVTVTRRLTLKGDRYLVDQDISIQNRSARSLEGEIGLQMTAKDIKKEHSFLQNLSGPPDQLALVLQKAGSVTRIIPDKEKQRGIEEGVISWVGLENRYFLSALVSRQLSEEETVTYRFADSRLQTALYYPRVIIPPRERTTVKHSIYFGPKEIDALGSVGVGLESAIDYGWFALIAVPIVHTLRFFHGLVGSWGLAIILLTILVKMLLNPLTVKGLRSMKGMQKLQPKLVELREKYKDDKQKLNQETMQMFRTHKINPMGGCLPMLLQMPIYIALYKVLYGSIELFHTPFLFYADLSAPDPYYVSPILLGIFMFFQQKMTPSASADPIQKKMMMIMPVMFTGFMVFLPLGLVVYILVNTVMTVVQHWMFNKDIRWRDILRGRFRVA